MFSSSLWGVYVHHGDAVSSRLGRLHERPGGMGHG